MNRFVPRKATPIDLGPAPTQAPPAAPHPLDEFLDDLYGPDEAPRSLIEAEDVQPRAGSPFPIGMWLWAAGTAAAAAAALVAILS